MQVKRLEQENRKLRDGYNKVLKQKNKLRNIVKTIADCREEGPNDEAQTVNRRSSLSEHLLADLIEDEDDEIDGLNLKEESEDQGQ